MAMKLLLRKRLWKIEGTVVPTTAICLIAIAILRETWAIINPAFLHTVQSSVPRVGDTLFWLLAM